MKFDIIIIGGGMVGAALACALRNSALKIALIDAMPETQHDHRLIALNYRSCEFFKRLGIWSMLASFAEPIREVHVSYRHHFGSTRITADELHLETLGHVVPAHHINTALYQSLSSIEWMRPATLTNLSQEKESVSITLNTQTTLECRLLIGADGTHSTVRTLLNLPTEITDHQQSAMVTMTDLQRSHHGIAYERFHQTGAIAMLPLHSANDSFRAATIWSDDNATIASLMQLSDDAFLQTLQQQFGYRLGRFKKTYQRVVFPLQTILTKRAWQQNVVLLGNAAHTLHPIAAQGLNLALYEVDVLAKNLLATNSWLPEQLLPRDSQQHASIRLSHYLPSLFIHPSFMLSVARQLGLIGLDLSSWAKRRFAQRAVG